MASQNGGFRERKTANGIVGRSPARPKRTASPVKKEGGFGVLDALRIIGGLLLLNCLLSYFITNDSVLWGWRPWFIRPKVLQRWWVRRTYPSNIELWNSTHSFSSKVPFFLLMSNYLSTMAPTHHYPCI